MTKPDPSFCFSPKTQGTTRMGSGQVRNRGLVLRPQTHQVSAGDFCARREEQLSCDNTSTTAKFSRLFSVIQMLGKYNLIISCRGKSSAESLVLLCPFSSPHPAAAAHPDLPKSTAPHRGLTISRDQPCPALRNHLNLDCEIWTRVGFQMPLRLPARGWHTHRANLLSLLE